VVVTQDHPELLPDAVVRYADHEDALIDLHLPAAANGTLVFLVHGGFWKQVWDRTHTRSQARALARIGYLVATPEYRRVGGGGGWPTTGADVEAAFSALPALLGELNLTWERTVAVGHSAGGHLVLWLTSRPGSRSRLDRVVSVAGVCDLVRADAMGLGGGAVAALLEGAAISAADPMTLLDQQPAEVFLVHGDADDLVPIELSRGFAERHRWAELIELSRVGHFEFLDPREPAWKTLTAAIGLGKSMRQSAP
jgi:acetyl esterase/lipase